MPFSETHKLFTDSNDALNFAKSIGFQDPFGLGISPREGFINKYQSGIVNVKILSLSVDEGIEK
jgi:hypothetical protein